MYYYIAMPMTITNLLLLLPPLLPLPSGDLPTRAPARNGGLPNGVFAEVPQYTIIYIHAFFLKECYDKSRCTPFGLRQVSANSLGHGHGYERHSPILPNLPTEILPTKIP